jgi:hypothetical protein
MQKYRAMVYSSSGAAILYSPHKGIRGPWLRYFPRIPTWSFEFRVYLVSTGDPLRWGSYGITFEDGTDTNPGSRSGHWQIYCKHYY